MSGLPPARGPRSAEVLPRIRPVESLATPPRPARPSREEGLAPALSAIARAVAESMSLKDVFSRSMPEDETFSVYSAVGKGGIEEIGLRYSRSDVSPQLRLNAMGQVVRHSDIATQLDPSFSLDRRAIELGTRSLLVTYLPGPRPLGSIWFASSEPDVYVAEDEETILAIADLVSPPFSR